MPSLSFSFGSGSQWYYVILAGFGLGMVVVAANTDAINRAPAASYGEATGITQTVRNYGASLGLAILGTILITQNRVNIQGTGAAEISKGIAQSMETIFYIMAAIMAATFVFAVIFVPRGKLEQVVAEGTYDAPAQSEAPS